MVQKILGWLPVLVVVLLIGCDQSTGNSEQKRNTNLTYKEMILRDRGGKDSLFRQPSESPLPTLSAIDTFSGLNYFPPDKNYRVAAVFKKTENSEPFKMAATGKQQDIYEEYGTLHFNLNGKPLTLHVYQNLRLKRTEEYQDYLFIPFKDVTSGETTYGGGRYLDFKIPDSDTVVLDFNKAYNPYCVYSFEYSCPIPPEENHLPVAIEAGEKDF